MAAFRRELEGAEQRQPTVPFGGPFTFQQPKEPPTPSDQPHRRCTVTSPFYRRRLTVLTASHISRSAGLQEHRKRGYPGTSLSRQDAARPAGLWLGESCGLGSPRGWHDGGVKGTGHPAVDDG